MLEELNNSPEMINSLILDLSLASSLPISADLNRNYIQAAAAASALGYRTNQMNKKELMSFEYTILPLLTLLKADIEDPIAAKSAYGIRVLLTSTECMNSFLQHDGLATISRILDILLIKKSSELKQHCNTRTIVEHLANCYREIGQFHKWEIVRVGAIRHCVLLLRYGDIPLQTISASTLVQLSTDLDICKQLFSYGAIKPILNVTDASVTNDACMLAGLGCIIQLCKIPEIGERMFYQGALPVLELGLHRQIGHGHRAIREKSLFAIELLSKIDKIRHSICTAKVLKAIKKEFVSGTMPSKITILHTLFNLHGRYPTQKDERDVVLFLRDHIISLLNNGPWHARNLCIKAVVVLYPNDDDREYFVEKGFIDSLYFVINTKTQDLQEAPVVALIYLMINPIIPPILLKRDAHKVAADLMSSEDPIIRELAVIFLKAILLYDQDAVTNAVPQDKRYLLQKDPYNPQLYGSEYGDMIMDYLQGIVEQRRVVDYLINSLTSQEIDEIQVTREELESYQNLFMELDVDCKGSLDLDELKILMVLMGEEMDKNELQDVLEEYDTDKSGALEFKEFVVMMKGWKTRRGPLGRAARTFNKWKNEDKVTFAQIQILKAKKKEEQQLGEELALLYYPHEKLQKDRENEMILREAGITKIKSQRSMYSTSRSLDGSASGTWSRSYDEEELQNSSEFKSKSSATLVKLPAINTK
eukprot:gene5304-7367_t